VGKEIGNHLTPARRTHKTSISLPVSIRRPRFSVANDLTRENVMKHASSLKNVQLDLSLPGIVNSTSPTDYRVNKQLQMMKFNGERWELFGPIIEDTGVSG
jgi:hypothetical protein